MYPDCINKEMNDSFLHVNSGKQLRNVLNRRYRQSNGVLLYHLEREVTSITQSNESVIDYFTRLQTLWDKFTSLQTIHVCECKASETLEAHNNKQIVIRFLMGLNDGYENIKDQILLLEPLPNIDRVYSMVLKAKRQRKVNHNS